MFGGAENSVKHTHTHTHTHTVSSYKLNIIKDISSVSVFGLNRNAFFYCYNQLNINN